MLTIGLEYSRNMAVEKAKRLGIGTFLVGFQRLWLFLFLTPLGLCQDNKAPDVVKVFYIQLLKQFEQTHSLEHA